MNQKYPQENKRRIWIYNSPWAENEPRRPGCDWLEKFAAIAKSRFPRRTRPENIFAPAVLLRALRAAAST